MRQTPFGFWLLIRYDDVLRFVRDPALSVEDRNATPGPLDAAMAETSSAIGPTAFSRPMLNRDPPDHTRLRRLVSQGVHAPGRSSACAPASRRWSTRRSTGRGRSGEMDADRRPRLPAAVHGHLRDARHARDRPRPAAGVVGHARPHPRADRRPRADARHRRRRRRHVATCIARRHRVEAAPTRPTTCSPRSSPPRTTATCSPTTSCSPR